MIFFIIFHRKNKKIGSYLLSDDLFGLKKHLSHKSRIFLVNGLKISNFRNISFHYIQLKFELLTGIKL